MTSSREHGLEARPSRWRRPYDRTFFDAATPDLLKGLRGAIVTLVPFYLAVRFARQEFAWIALGGWFGTLVDPGGLRGTRIKTLSVFALVSGVALATTEQVAKHAWLSAANLLVVAFAASLFRALGAVWASAGTMVTVVVAIGAAKGGSDAWRDGGFFTLGAAIAAFLSAAVWPIWTYLPLRRAEADVFSALASYAREIEACVRDGTPEGDPRWVSLARLHHRSIRAAVEEARRLVIGGRSRRAGETRIGSNLRILLGLAESQLPLLVTLKEALELASEKHDHEDVLARLGVIARRDVRTAATLRTPNLRSRRLGPAVPPSGAAPGSVSSMAALLDHLEDTSRVASVLSQSLDTRSDTATVRPAPGRRARPPFGAALSADLALLRDACSVRSPFFKHGIRVASTVFVAQLVARRISAHPYWVTVTTLAVLQPYAGATSVRAAQRVVGTVLGSVVAAIITLTVESPLVLAGVMFPLSVAAVATHRRNYRLFTFFLTPVFVLLAERFHGDFWTAAERASDAVVGGAIAFASAAFVFPSRERTRLPELLANMLEALRRYAVAVLRGTRDRHNDDVAADVDATRRSAGISLGETETALERLLAEPRHERADEEYALELITYSRRLTSALTAVDTYAARDLLADRGLSETVAARVESYMVGSLDIAAAAARGDDETAETPVPELPADLDSDLRTTLARSLRWANLIARARSPLRSAKHQKNQNPRDGHVQPNG